MARALYPQLLKDLFEEVVELRWRYDFGERPEAIGADLKLDSELVKNLAAYTSDNQAFRRLCRETAVAMARDGKSDEEIGKRLWYSKAYVGQIRNRAGIKRRSGPHGVQGELKRKKVCELAKAGKTDQEIAEVVGFSARYIRNIRTRAGIKHQKKARNMAATRRLFKAGKSDQEIANKLHLSRRTVIKYRQAMRLLRPSGGGKCRKYTEEHDIRCVRKWHELNGRTPSVLDWCPSMARAKGQPDRAERFIQFREKYRCASLSSIRQRHGSWSAFIAKTGLPPAPRGSAAHGLHSR